MDIFGLIISVAVLLISITFLHFIRRLCSLFIYIKDPSFPPVTGTVFTIIFHYNRLHDRLTELARTNRTYSLLAPGGAWVYTTDVRNIEHLLKENFDKYTKGRQHQEVLADLLGDGIFSVDGDKWRKQRKLASFEFSTRVLRDFSCSVFRTGAAKLVRVMHQLGTTGQCFDMQDILMKYTLDSIFKVGFGVELNCLEGTSKEGIEFMNAFDEMNALVYMRFFNPFWKRKKYFNIGSEASLKKNIRVVTDFVNGVISTKRKLLAQYSEFKNDKEDILSRLLVEREKDKEGMNDKYLKDIILNFMIAGKDTTANTLSWFFYMLCKNPLIQEKVAQEVMNVTRSQDAEPGIEEFMATTTDATLEQVHYLHAALTETLRLYPALPVDGRHAEMDDTLPDGFRIRKGDYVYYLAYGMGRMPHIWGDDAEDFRPERWIKNGVFQPESPFKFVSFHAGPRMCLGRDFAYRQMKIVAMALLRFFRFRLEDESREVTYKTMFTLHINGGLHLCALPRTKLKI